MYGESEVLGQIISGVPFESALYVGLKPHDNEGGILPIVADLTTTDETAWVRSIGEIKAGRKKGAFYESRWDKHRRDVEVGFYTPKAGADIHADGPTGPVIDRRWREGAAALTAISAAKAGVPINPATR